MKKLGTIIKYRNWDEVPKNNLDFWLKKTPNERLAAAKILNNLADKIYQSNNKNLTTEYGRRISKFRSFAERE